MADEDRKQCTQCGHEFGTAVLVWTSKGEACPPCAEKLEAGTPLKLPPLPVMLALGITAAPLFMDWSVTVNGDNAFHYDFVAIPAGAIGLVLGIWALRGQLRAQPRNKLHLGMAALAIPLGLFQLLVPGLRLLG